MLVSNNLGQKMSNPAILSVFAAAAPVISTNPVAPPAVFVGQTATFTVVATGSPTLQYQWEVNHVAIPGAKAASYTTPALMSTNSAMFIRSSLPTLSTKQYPRMLFWL